MTVLQFYRGHAEFSRNTTVEHTEFNSFWNSTPPSRRQDWGSESPRVRTPARSRLMQFLRGHRSERPSARGPRGLPLLPCEGSAFLRAGRAVVQNSGSRRREPERPHPKGGCDGGAGPGLRARKTQVLRTPSTLRAPAQAYYNSQDALGTWTTLPEMLRGRTGPARGAGEGGAAAPAESARSPEPGARRMQDEPGARASP